jgi:hypothetical protein
MFDEKNKPYKFLVDKNDESRKKKSFRSVQNPLELTLTFFDQTIEDKLSKSHPITLVSECKMEFNQFILKVAAKNNYEVKESLLERSFFAILNHFNRERKVSEAHDAGPSTSKDENIFKENFETIVVSLEDSMLAILKKRKFLLENNMGELL